MADCAWCGVRMDVAEEAVYYRWTPGQAVRHFCADCYHEVAGWAGYEQPVQVAGYAQEALFDVG